MGDGRIVLNFERRRDEASCLGVIATLCLDDAQQMQSVEIPRLGIQNLTIRRFRVVQLPHTVQINSTAQQRQTAWSLAPIARILRPPLPKIPEVPGYFGVFPT